MTENVPPRPEAPEEPLRFPSAPVEAPAKKRPPLGVIVGLAVVGALALGVAIGQSDGDTDVAGSGPGVVAEVDDEPCVTQAASDYADRAAELMMDATTELEVNGFSGIQESADLMDASADYIEMQIDEVHNAPEVQSLLSRVADETRASADDLRSMRLGEATKHMKVVDSLYGELIPMADGLSAC